MSDRPEQHALQTLDGFKPAGQFGGFLRPDANFVFTPNQYLDLCIPHASRGCARLVGYMLRHLIGWRDADGNPLYEKVEVTQRELERRSGVGKSSVNAALAEAESLGFILCVTRGRPNVLGGRAVQNAWALRWDDSGGYAETLGDFRGFYRGEGRRTTVPNEFFDVVLPRETHGVVRVVAAVIRHTVGYQNRLTGGSLTRAPLSFGQLARYANCGRRTIARALPQAVAANYVCRVTRGRFASDADRQEASVYAIRWAQDRDAPKMAPGAGSGRPENGTSSTPRKWHHERPENGTSERPENGTTINKQQRHSERQQQGPAAAPLEDSEETRVIALLLGHGLDRPAAARLSERVTLAEVRQQIEWLPHRRAASNQAGLLRRAIEEGYGPPAELVRSTVLRAEREAREREVVEQVRGARESECRQRHEEAHRDTYLDHVLGLDERLSREHPERHAELLARRSHHRRVLQALSISPAGKARAIDRHDSGRSFAADLAETFSDEVPDFWTWDRTLNANPLGS